MSNFTSEIDFNPQYIKGTMYSTGRYSYEDTMSSLICENPSMLLVLSRFAITLGQGDKTIDEVCVAHGVDTYTFLSVVNLLVTDTLPDDQNKVLPLSLLKYLEKSHEYFISYRLPDIRRKLSDALCDTTAVISKVIMDYFDEYVKGVKEHMGYEETVVFPYVRKICGDDTELNKYHIDIFKDHHDNIDELLSELKDIIIKYYPAGINFSMSDALFDIYSCSEDLALHAKVEDMLLVPAVKNIELSHKK